MEKKSLPRSQNCLGYQLFPRQEEYIIEEKGGKKQQRSELFLLEMKILYVVLLLEIKEVCLTYLSLPLNIYIYIWNHLSKKNGLISI